MGVASISEIAEAHMQNSRGRTESCAYVLHVVFSVFTINYDYVYQENLCNIGYEHLVRESIGCNMENGICFEMD